MCLEKGKLIGQHPELAETYCADIVYDLHNFDIAFLFDIRIKNHNYNG